MTWVLRQCVLCTPLHANGSPGPVAGGATGLCCTVLPPRRSLRRRRLAKISGRASPPGPPRPHGDSQEIVAVTSHSVEVGPVARRQTCWILISRSTPGGRTEGGR